MQRKEIVRLPLLVFAAIVVLLSLPMGGNSIAGVNDEQACDVGADYSLGVEDYTEAIRCHVQVLKDHPDDAVAHYHLGFAFGMVGNTKAELGEYQHAEALGLTSWDLFLNLGLAQLENGDLDAATDSLRRAVLFGENHPESHFNLALVDERRGMLANAEHEIRASLLLDPEQPDARNLLGVIYARERKISDASRVWQELISEMPDYEPARANLAISGNPSEGARGETVAVDLPPAAAVNAIMSEH
jgi:tetratricopeptide (TPR) repeat protein